MTLQWPGDRASTIMYVRHGTGRGLFSVTPINGYIASGTTYSTVVGRRLDIARYAISTVDRVRFFWGSVEGTPVHRLDAHAVAVHPTQPTRMLLTAAIDGTTVTVLWTPPT